MQKKTHLFSVQLTQLRYYLVAHVKDVIICANACIYGLYTEE